MLTENLIAAAATPAMLATSSRPDINTVYLNQYYCCREFVEEEEEEEEEIAQEFARLRYVSKHLGRLSPAAATVVN
jgi:hypothetical protein